MSLKLKTSTLALSSGLAVKNLLADARTYEFNSWSGKISHDIGQLRMRHNRWNLSVPRICAQ